MVRPLSLTAKKMLSIAVLIALALGLSYAGVGYLRLWAERREVLDVPNERSSHSRPTPRGGGLAIAIITLAGLWFIAWCHAAEPRLPLLAYTFGAALVVVVGWLDDVRSLPRSVRFAAHSLAALLVMGGIGYGNIADALLFGQVRLGWLGLPIIFLWVVGLTNAYNFMDGIDGIAGGQAVVASLGWALIGWASGLPLLSNLGLLLAASSFGFLGHNWPPARIFMGDVGSGFLGYTFAVLPLMRPERAPSLILSGIFLLWPFLFDSVFTFLRRLGRGENVFAAHRSHVYQRLVIAGCSHGFVTLLYVGLALVGGVLSYMCVRGVRGAYALITLPVPLLFVGLWLYVVRQERRKCMPTIPSDRVMASERF